MMIGIMTLLSLREADVDERRITPDKKVVPLDAEQDVKEARTRVYNNHRLLTKKPNQDDAF